MATSLTFQANRTVGFNISFVGSAIIFVILGISPSSQSTSELPSVSIYDDLVFRNNCSSPSAEDQPPVNIVEAYNISVKTPLSEASGPESLSNCETLAGNISEQNAETNCKKLSLPMSSIVSIEDIEDDDSEDELYSPKTPKNFIETDNVSKFFVIENISPHNPIAIESENIHKSENCSLDSEQTKCSDSSGPQNILPPDEQLILPPPLNCDDSPSDCNDFDDFADFQDYTNSPLAETVQQSPQTLVPGKENKNLVLEENEANKNSLCFEETAFDDNFNDFTSYPNIEYNGNQEENYNQDNNNEDYSNSIQENDTYDSVSADLSLEDNGNKECFESAENSFDDFESSPEDITAAIVRNSAQKEDENLAFDKKQINDAEHSEKVLETEVLDEDEFADFAQHEEFLNVANNEISAKSQNTIDDKEAENSDDDDDDDDDFGDFNTAEPQPQTATNVTNLKANASQTSFTPPVNLNERILKILQLMFTSDECNTIGNTSTADVANRTCPNSNKLLDIPFTSIDAAKALEYQWSNSETRHTFIKSLGIDSRNIVSLC